jgi:hypothetical protein
MMKNRWREGRGLWLAGGLAAMLLVAVAPTRAGYLESDYPTTGQAPTVAPAPTPTPPPPPPPRPVSRNPVTSLLDDLALGEPYAYRGLAVYPLTLVRGTDGRRYQTLSEGLANGTLAVREREEGVVSELVLRNSGDTYTFLLAGELVLGGKQNRLLRQDVLLPPRSGDVIVSVYCGQKGRWTSPDRFESKQSVAPSSLRQRAMAGAPQADVWGGIGENTRRLDAASASEDLQQVYETPAVREALADYRAKVVDYLRRRQAVGFVVARYGQIVGAEAFRSASLFERLRGQLIDSYAVDCIGWEPEEWRRRAVWPPTGDALAFLNRAYRASFDERPSPGAGQLITVSGASTGQALALGGACVHLSLYQPAPIIVRPPPPPRPPRPVPPPTPMPGPEER